MTKNEIIYTVLNRVKEGAKVNTTKVHPIDVENTISMYRSALLKNAPLKELDFYTKQYTATLQDDGTNGRKYVDLPVNIEDLNRVSKGVISVSLAAGYDFKFYPITEREMKLYNGLEASTVTGSGTRIGYRTYFDRIEFDTAMSELTDITTVRLLLIPTFDGYASTDNVPLGKFEKDILEMSANYLLGIPQPDLKNN